MYAIVVQLYAIVLINQHQIASAIKQVSGGYFRFQQDNAPAHPARETIDLPSRETPHFIAPQSWPPNSPDLNSVDYRIWSVPKECVYRTRIRIQNVDHRMTRLIKEWRQFDQQIISSQNCGFVSTH